MMDPCTRLRWWACATLLLIIALTSSPALVAAQEPGHFKGRSLTEALQALQGQGLQIVFTSATVTPDMRVEVEPRARTARQLLDALLAPHGLRARPGPGAIIEVVRADAAQPRSPKATLGTMEGTVVDAATTAPLPGVMLRIDGMSGSVRTGADGRFVLREVQAGTRHLRAAATGYEPATRTVDVTAGGTVTIQVSLSVAVSTHREYVSVIESLPYRKDHGVASETSVPRTQWEQSYGSLADDPVRVVQALPRVTPLDDFRSEFAVRGSPFRHVDFVIDGVATHWLRHTAHERGATGSLVMFPAMVIEGANLRAGAYPRRDGDRLGPQLDFTIREGSRREVRWQGGIGGTSVTLLGEGPLGLSARGSWLVALRQSYLEWPTERPESTRTPFGFFDGVAKLVYDVRPSQRVALSVLGGTSSIDGEDNLAPNELGDGTNRALAVNLSWRTNIGSTVMLTQRASVVRHHFLNKHQTGLDSDRGSNAQIVYRADVTRPIARGLLEVGGQIGRIAVNDVPRVAEADAIAGTSWMRSGYAHLAWPVTSTLTLSPGMRMTASAHLRQPVLGRWLLSEWAFRPRWAIKASLGISRQLPELRHVLGRTAALAPRAERARHFDVAIEQQLSGDVRWQATMFSRTERDILREPDIHPRFVNDVMVAPERRYANALEGSSHGIELLLERQSTGRLSAWAAYSYGETRFTDAERRESFWGDFDQRHTLTLVGRFRFPTHTSAGATLRMGSNFPIPGYLAATPHGLAVGAGRNQLRLPAYARIDVRADHGFERFGRRLTVFVEALNLLNRPNAGLTGGYVDAATGEANGFTDSLFGRRASAGVFVEF